MYNQVNNYIKLNSNLRDTKVSVVFTKPYAEKNVY